MVKRQDSFCESKVEEQTINLDHYISHKTEAAKEYGQTVVVTIPAAMQQAILNFPETIIEEEPEELPLIPRKNANVMLNGKIQELISRFNTDVDLK